MKDWNCLERDNWKTENDMKVSNIKAEMIVKKLAKHFKLPIRHIEFYGFRDSGQASSWRCRIRLGNNPSVHVICHEVCHFLCWKKVRDRKLNFHPQHGSKKWLRQLKIVHNYVIKNNYWKEELERRTAPKEPKPEPTPRELRLKKIERFEAGIKRHQTKIKRCQTLIKKNNRRISALKRFI